MKSIAISIFVCLALSACQLTPSPTQSLISSPAVNTPTPQVIPTPPAAPCLQTTPLLFPGAVKWLRDNATPLPPQDDTFKPLALEWLRNTIGEARVVALGEATHGTHEFQVARLQILRFLVEKMGFNGIAVEVPWIDTLRIDQYVQTGRGDPSELIHDLSYWPYQTQETIDLIRWMAAYNTTLTPSSRIHFWGFDVPYPTAQKAIDVFLAYLRQVDTPEADRAYKTLACMRLNNYTTFGRLPAAYKADCRDGLERLLTSFLTNESSYTSRFPQGNFPIAYRSLEAILQAETAYSTVFHYSLAGAIHTANDPQVRDALMADNVTSLATSAGPQTKVVVVAHNTHTGINYYVNFDGQGTMGALLRGQFGTDYLPIEFYFYGGHFNAVPFEIQHESLQPVQDSYESFFHTVNLPAFFVDLRTARPGTPAAAWLLGPHCMRSIASSYDDAYPQGSWGITNLSQQTDAVVFFQQSTPTKLLIQTP